jgi:hypothetical protein
LSRARSQAAALSRLSTLNGGIMSAAPDWSGWRRFRRSLVGSARKLFF